MKENNTLKIVERDNESYFEIKKSDQLRPFFMSIVSDANHWLFTSSNGGLTAGRKNSEFALFPYYTDDKIIESADITGSKTIFRIKQNDALEIWEPFSNRYTGKYNIQRNLYKNVYGNKVIFEEINHDLNLTFAYQWNTSSKYGFIRKCNLINHGDTKVTVEVLDGIQNIMPYGVGSDIQNRSSNLVDAYKRNELEPTSGLGIFALSAIIVDKAEPSEALKANTAWSLGFDHPTFLVSSLQLNDYRNGKSITQETDIKAEKGAYFVFDTLKLVANAQKDWLLVADVNQSHADIAKLKKAIKTNGRLEDEIIKDIEEGTKNLIRLTASADGLQATSDSLQDARHFSNTLFNIMRGGIFDHNYRIEQWDFLDYLENANKQVYQNAKTAIEKMGETFSLFKLKELNTQNADPDFQRLCLEYLPLKFSRRHGDPSRPWNKFSINTQNEDGSKILDYEGNWRDIFQNWEALALSFPEFIESMIHKFLNASTFDGYNPYRITKKGFDWETIEPDDPWSYIGYWGDHQIIYLLKFLEFIEDVNPGRLNELFNQNIFVYANVPYKIKSYQKLLANPKDTIDFDLNADEKIREARNKIGVDGALLKNQKGEIVHINFIEKILATTLAKVSNFIAEGGIWMNTQRPEWNDANNALVGNGVSMVTLYYLRRFFNFFQNLFAEEKLDDIYISTELAQHFTELSQALEENVNLLDSKFTDKQRKSLLDKIGQSASDYREKIYQNGFAGMRELLKIEDLQSFINLGLKFTEHTIYANRKEDGLYHAYNLMTVENQDEISIASLNEMLEGQVAVLSSGYLTSDEALNVLDSMKDSPLFREDQYSYLLYPNKELPGFLERNNINAELVGSSKLFMELVEKENTQILEKDVGGVFHFNGNFKNAKHLSSALDNLDQNNFENLSSEQKKIALDIFEKVFKHKAFTGRSGTFYGYEGLGSIYWHMVSKLQLAVQETCLNAIKTDVSKETIGKLLEHYYEIQAGIGVHKSPTLYGAFPTDPYSHTPAGKGAQQPGMTGQVKEDILSRFGELGVSIKQGEIYFNPQLLQLSEFSQEPIKYNYVDLDGKLKVLHTSSNSLVFTYCQIPVVYELSDSSMIKIEMDKDNMNELQGVKLNAELSHQIFARVGKIRKIHVKVDSNQLK